jgi:GDPmannose 4,6-dehydratase
MPRALILGATGQDGQYLSDFLLTKKYEVLGVSRSKNPFQENPLSLRRPAFKSVDISNTTLLKNVLDDFNPDEIYNLAGESSVSRSFKEPSETVESNVVGVVNLLTTVIQN